MVNINLQPRRMEDILPTATFSSVPPLALGVLVSLVFPVFLSVPTPAWDDPAQVLHDPQSLRPQLPEVVRVLQEDRRTAHDTYLEEGFKQGVVSQ